MLSLIDKARRERERKWELGGEKKDKACYWYHPVNTICQDVMAAIHGTYTRYVKTDKTSWTYSKDIGSPSSEKNHAYRSINLTVTMLFSALFTVETGKK